MPIFIEYINTYLNAYFGVRLPFHAIVIALIIFILALAFIWFYVRTAVTLWFKLKRLRFGLQAFKCSEKSQYPTVLFHRDGLLKHLWSEYKETLHEQRTTNPQTGIEEISAIRSTIPAEAFFNPVVLVDGQLHTEFFKHLPGILTGMGIIGTFLGLIHGLSAFQLSEDTQIVRQSLDQLLHGVYEAFLISAAAIGIAMIITAIEKFFLSTLYRHVEELCFLIDGLYESGANEEYLERLVKSAENSANQAYSIKDALVEELNKTLHEIARQNMEFTASNQRQLSEQFKQMIQSGIGDPLQAIVASLKNQHEQTSQNISGALDGVLTSFTQRLQDLFGGQTAGIQTLQQQTAEALQQTVQQFQRMATGIDATGRDAATVMTEKLAQTMETADLRQQTMNEHMTQFLNRLQSLTQESQAETKRNLHDLFGDLGQYMTRITSDLQTQTQAATDDQHGRQQQIAEATLSAITALSGGVQSALHAMQGQLANTLTQLEQHTQQAAAQQQEQQRQLATQNQRAVQQLTAGVDQTVHQISTQTTDLLAGLVGTVENQQRATAETTRSIQTAIAKMSSVTTAALTDMNRGAEMLMSAAKEFGKAGQSVAGILGEATGVTVKFSASAEAVSNAAHTLETIVADYGTVRRQLSDMMQSLKSVVEAARKEASLTTDIVARIDGAAQKLATAQNQTDRYLTQVTDVLQQTHQEFASGMRRTVGEANQQFFNHLTAATSRLREAIEELDVTLSGIDGRVARS